MDSTVECRECGFTKEVSFGYCTTHGWPKHCGRTMRLVKSPEDVGAAMDAVFAPIGEHIRREIHKPQDQQPPTSERVRGAEGQ